MSQKNNPQLELPLLATITDADFDLPFEDFAAPMRTSVRAVLFDAEGKVALLTSNEYGYMLPGGQIEPGETHDQTLFRECKEEAGVAIEVITTLGTVVEERVATLYKKTSHGYLAQTVGDKGKQKFEQYEKKEIQTLLRVPLDKAIQLIKAHPAEIYVAKFALARELHFLTAAKQYIEEKKQEETGKNGTSKSRDTASLEKQEEMGEGINNSPTSEPVSETKSRNVGANQQTIDNSPTSEHIDIARIQKDLADIQQIASKAQYDYINLKMDFDGYRTRMEKQLAEGKIDMLVDVVRKFLPFVESLRKSLLTLSDELKEQPLAKGVQMTYDNFLATLADMAIRPIDALGLSLDSVLHEPVSVQPTDNPELKGKITMEFEQGFVYKKGDVQKVVKTSKVVVGQ